MTGSKPVALPLGYTPLLSKLFRGEYCNGLAKKNLQLAGIILRIFSLSKSLSYFMNIEEPVPERQISKFSQFFS